MSELHANPAVQVATELQLSPFDAWQLVVDGQFQRAWLGDGSVLQDRTPAALSQFGALWRTGSTVLVDRHSRAIRFSLTPNTPWNDIPATSVTIRVVPGKKEVATTSIVTVQESVATGDIGPDARVSLESFWRSAFHELNLLCEKVRTQRRVAQAVVVVHGVGEQIPGDTLNGFVDAAAASGMPEGMVVRSKPDFISKTLELRQLTVPPFGDVPRTDFYEFYWAHEIRDTTATQVIRWLWSLTRRPHRDISKGMLPAWYLLRMASLLMSIAVMAWIASVVQTEGLLAMTGLVSAGLSTMLGIVSLLFVRNLGDAARYLSALPENVQARERIRRNGVELLERLHESARYSRISIVGHSLGSVIAYDIVTHLWTRMHRDHHRPTQVRFAANGDLHRYQGNNAAKAQVLQYAAWRESRSNTLRWLITDLITVGSPLTHASTLMARNGAEFEVLKRSRELPTAPPVRDERADDGIPAFFYQTRYTDRAGKTTRTFRYLHHAAPFALVRWTNLYFPAHAGVLGDPVGGPVADLFGSWVRDQPLSVPRDWPRHKRLWLHSAYWRPSNADGHSAEPTTPLDRIRAALDLAVAPELDRTNRSRPPYALLGGEV